VSLSTSGTFFTPVDLSPEVEDQLLIPTQTRCLLYASGYSPASINSPRELAVTFTDTKSYYVSQASVNRLLKAHDLITSPAFILIKTAD
jgi:hypothetical protein